MMKIVPLLSFLLLLIIFAEHAKAKQDCKTDTGDSCKFPFTFQGVRYNACTTDHSENGAPWCATQVNNRGESVKFGVCAAFCPGVGCKTFDNGDSCKFPFTFKGVRYDACTTQVIHGNCAPWCATEVNNRGEAVRQGICAATCPGAESWIPGPVCGKDNETYGNMCEAGKGNVNCPGECPCLLDVILDQVLDENSAFWNFVRRVWGGSCDSKDHCIDYVASCGDEGECRPSWWVWMILACIVLAVVVIGVYLVWLNFFSS